jgi:prepilin-type N-terminal cleavage/methylation domain-containing protein
MSARKKNGFTLIELLITISVFVLISSMTLVNYPNFIQRINLSQASQEIMLAFRETQTKSMGVQAFLDPQSGNFVYPSYGIHFEKSNPREFTIFADVNKNGKFDSGNQETVSRFFIQKADIADLCVSSGEDPPSGCGQNKLDIVYKRPEPVIIIKSEGEGSPSAAAVIVSGPDGKRNRIVIWITGQVYVETIQ